jgi:hypothetical protein
MNFGVEPCRIIESAGFDERDARHHGDIREDGRAALRTEVSVDRLPTIARVVKRLELSLNRQSRFWNSDEDRESRPRLLLTVLAMAYSDKGGVCIRRIANLAAQAATGHFWHLSLLPLP